MRILGFGIATLLGTETITKEAIDGKNTHTTCQRSSSNLPRNADGWRADGWVNASTVVTQTGEILATTQRPTL